MLHLTTGFECLTFVLPEEDIIEHLLGHYDGRSTPAVPRLATSHAQTGQCREWYVLEMVYLSDVIEYKRSIWNEEIMYFRQILVCRHWIVSAP